MKMSRLYTQLVEDLCESKVLYDGNYFPNPLDTALELCMIHRLIDFGIHGIYFHNQQSLHCFSNKLSFRFYRSRIFL